MNAAEPTLKMRYLVQCLSIVVLLSGCTSDDVETAEACTAVQNCRAGFTCNGAICVEGLAPYTLGGVTLEFIDDARPSELFTYLFADGATTSGQVTLRFGTGGQDTGTFSYTRTSDSAATINVIWTETSEVLTTTWQQNITGRYDLVITLADETQTTEMGGFTLR